MTPALLVLCAWLLFAGSHLALGLPPLRDRLAGRLGEPRFVALFSAVAATTLGMLALAVARVADAGLPGPALGALPFVRIALMIAAWLGVALAIIGLLNYMRSPMALFRTRLHAPTGIERITRHAFFVGLTLFAAAHALLASTLASSVHFTGFALLASAGAMLQDRKLIGRHGGAYVDYMAATSLIPMLAVLQGRQRLSTDGQLLWRLGVSAALALLMFATHSLWSVANGALLAGLMAVGGLVAAGRRWRFANRAGDRQIADR